MALVHYWENDFLQEVKRTFPELRDQINHDNGLLHVEMGTLARHAQGLMDVGSTQEFARVVELLDRYFDPKNERLEHFNNAVFVSFLEHLSFEGEVR